MYQETLFFLIPFYFYSTTFPSWNSGYVVVLGALAVLSCFDFVFDRMLRENRVFALGFFAFVSYSALQFFLPLLLRVRVANGAYLAAVVSFVAAVALADIRRELREPKKAAALAVALVLLLGVVKISRPLVPPAPLRLTKVQLSSRVDRRTLRATRDFGDEIRLRALGRDRLYATATVFSPSRLPATVTMRFLKDGKVLRTSRTVEVNVHAGGFRVWDSVRVGSSRGGKYRVEVWTADGQLVGRRSVRLVE
jgi:hypothetical protein